MDPYGVSQPLNSAPPYYNNANNSSDQYQQYGAQDSASPQLDAQPQPTKQCNDKLWAVLFVLHLLCVTIIGAVCLKSYSGQLMRSDTVRIDRKTVLLCVAVFGIGAAAALSYLLLVRAYASALIKFTLGLGIVFNIAILCVSAFAVLAGAGSGGIMGIVIGAVMLVLNLLYIYCVWSRIPFASALLTMATKPVSTFNGTILVAFLGILVQSFWTAVWTIATFAIYAALTPTSASQSPDANAPVQPNRVALVNPNTQSSVAAMTPAPLDPQQQQVAPDVTQRDAFASTSRRNLLSLQHDASEYSVASVDTIESEAFADSADSANWAPASANSPQQYYSSPPPPSYEQATTPSWRTTNAYQTRDTYSNYRDDGFKPSSHSDSDNNYEEHDKMKPGTVIALIALVLSFFWTSQVIKNVVHCTIAGVAASWYFIYPNPVESVTSGALKRSLTTSFGSICLGSLIVAVIQTINAIIQYLRNQLRENDGSAAAQCLLCILQCIVECIESIVDYINSYAYAYIAIYGRPYCESAKNTIDLLRRTFLLPVINDSLIGGVLTFGSIFGGLITGLSSALLAWLVFAKDMWLIAAIIGFLVGWAMTAIVCEVVHSCVIALMICWAENSDALRVTKPDCYASLSETIGERIDIQQQQQPPQQQQSGWV